ncbi:MAG: hypothetical protein RSB23_02075 [Alistipes sp.]
MRKLIVLFVVMMTAVSLSSCQKAIEKARRNIRVEAVEQVEVHALSGVDITLRVMNNTGHRLSLHTAELKLFYDSNYVGNAVLREAVEVPKRATTSITTRWKVKISDPIALYLMSKKINQGDISLLAVSFDLTGKGGPAPITISQQMIPLSDFLRIFGVSIEEVKNRFK